MNHRNDEDRRDYPSTQPYGAPRGGLHEPMRQGRSRHDYDVQSDRNRAPQYAQSGRNRGEYYGGEQFDERTQSAGWNEDRGNWDYEGGPERYGASSYWEGEPGTLPRQQSGRLRGSQFGGRREYGSQNTGASDYYSGRQGYVSQGSFGSDYNTYGRSQGYGEGSGYTHPQPPRSRQFAEGQNYGSTSLYGGESAGSGGRSSLYRSQEYLDDGEMSGYGRRDPGLQQYGTSSGRYGAAPGQYGYGIRAGSFRGVGPKNYARSDERVMEDINERLTDDDDLDASEITVRVADGKVTLEGNVDQRWMKHRAEDIADSCIGVKEVDNRIQVTAGGLPGQRPADARSPSRTVQTSTAAGTSGTTGGTTSH